MAHKTRSRGKSKTNRRRRNRTIRRRRKIVGGAGEKVTNVLYTGNFDYEAQTRDPSYFKPEVGQVYDFMIDQTTPTYNNFFNPKIVNVRSKHYDTIIGSFPMPQNFVPGNYQITFVSDDRIGITNAYISAVRI